MWVWTSSISGPIPWDQLSKLYWSQLFREQGSLSSSSFYWQNRQVSFNESFLCFIETKLPRSGIPHGVLGVSHPKLASPSPPACMSSGTMPLSSPQPHPFPPSWTSNIDPHLLPPPLPDSATKATISRWPWDSVPFTFNPLTMAGASSSSPSRPGNCTRIALPFARLFAPEARAAVSQI